jgi:hypothetical protein
MVEKSMQGNYMVLSDFGLYWGRRRKDLQN